MMRGAVCSLVLGIGFACQTSTAATPAATPAGGGGAPVVAADQGARRIERASFVLEIDAPPTAVGGEGKARLRMRANPGWHVNKEFPTSLVVEAPAGIEVKKPKQTAADATSLTESEIVLEVAYVVRASGTVQLPATFKFAVCTSTSCEPQREKLTIPLKTQ